jgi:predicted metal-dependent phosphoesterase TrpH
MQWKRMDLHVHTPASSDYQEEDVSYLDILQTAEARGADIVAFTDHNTVAGCREMKAEITDLELLERLNRIQPGEKWRLDEYRRLGNKLLILPGFEFTATLGFHVLGIFPPDTAIRELEYLLLSLRIPAEELDKGSMTVGATADVTTAYAAIQRAGGLAIAAHANSSHGVAMRGFDFGGQTKIAYTQDPHLHALEVTDLEKRGRFTTARFFDGRKPEYPRPMRCIQGSDAHRLTGDARSRRNLGVAERMTEILLPELSFDALLEVFEGNDFSRTRPYRASKEPVDFVQQAREEGPSIIQSFHESATKKGGRMYAITADVCAFANTNGGTVYIGVSSNAKKEPVGVDNPSSLINSLLLEIDRKVAPELEVQADVQETRGRPIIRLVVPRGPNPPYAIDYNKIYVRDEADTNMAVRDEIVALVRRALADETPTGESAEALSEAEEVAKLEAGEVQPPRTGVEIAETMRRKGVTYHSMRDLRNNNVVNNVTRKSARRLWHYAITQKEQHPVKAEEVEWQGDIALLRSYRRSGVRRYDLAQRDGDEIRVYYGVTEDGMSDEWLHLLPLEES